MLITNQVNTMNKDITFNSNLKQLLKDKVNNVDNTNDSYNFNDKDTTKLMKESHYHHVINDIVLLMHNYGYRNVLDNIEVAYYNMYYGKFDNEAVIDDDKNSDKNNDE